MNKTEYIAAIEADLTAANALCVELRTLRNFKKIAQSLNDADKMVSFDVLDKTITTKEADLQKLRSALGKKSTGRKSTKKDDNGTVRDIHLLAFAAFESRPPPGHILFVLHSLILHGLGHADAVTISVDSEHFAPPKKISAR